MTIVASGNPSDFFLALIEDGSFNQMDGKVVTKALRADRGLWEAVLFARTDDLGITLRDMPGGSYNADTIYILTDQARQEDLQKIVYPWRPPSITILTSTNTWTAGRYDNEQGTYVLKQVESPDREDRLANFLGSHQHVDDRVVFKLWWD